MPQLLPPDPPAGKYHARRYTTKGTVFMHRQIMNTLPGQVVDHINGHSTDNRRVNMRNCHAHQNAYNKPPRGKKSRCKGIYPSGARWEACIKHQGRRHHLGTFPTELEAALARDAKARELEGEYAYINVPEEYEKPQDGPRPCGFQDPQQVRPGAGQTRPDRLHKGRGRSMIIRVWCCCACRRVPPWRRGRLAEAFHHEGINMGLLNNLLVRQRPRSRLRGIGTFLPDRVVDNAELSALITCADDELRAALPRYIESLTGIQTRRWTDRTESPSRLAARAAQAAFDAAGLQGSDIDTLIFAATDLDHLEPATATIVQEHLGLGCVNSFDVKCACNSVLQAMFVMDALIAAGACRRGLIVCGEAGSQWANLEIRSREELLTKLGGLTLGDGGAAVILEAADDERGLLEFNLTTLPNSWRHCHVPHDIEWRTREERSVMGWFYLDLNSLAQVVREQVPVYCDEYAAYRRARFGEVSFIDTVHYLVPARFRSG